MNIFPITNTLEHNKIINYLFLGLAFCLPISKAGVNFFEILILLTWLLQGNWKYKFQAYQKSKIIMSLFAFISFMLISIFWAKDMYDGIAYVAKYRHFLIILVFYTELDKKYIEHIISAFLASMLISEIVSYGIFFELWNYNNVPVSDPAPFMDHISYSVFLSFASIILLNRIYITKEIKYKLFYFLLFFSVTANLFVNGGRTGQIAWVAALIFITFKNIKHKLQAFLGSLLLLGIIISSAYTLSENFNVRAKQLQTDYLNIQSNDYNSSLGARVSLWVMGFDEMTDTISLGSGIGNEMNNIKKYAQKHNFNASIYDTYADHHNMFITYGILLGPMGLLLVLFIFYFIYTLSLKNKIYKNLNQSFILIFALWSFTGITFHAMDAMTLFALFVGLFNAISFEKQEV